jgi:hypothetical protein
MTTIKSIFFDIGDTLGTAVLSPPPVQLVRVDLFPYVMARSSTVIPPIRKDRVAKAQAPAGGVQVVSSSSG